MNDLIKWPPTLDDVHYFVRKKKEWHRNNPTQRVWNANHNLVGALGEFVFGMEFDLKPDLRVEPKRPFWIDFRTSIGTIDVKSTETESTRIHLLRQVNKPHADILVLAHVTEHSFEGVQLLGWEYDSEMLKCPTMRIERWKNGALNHYKLAEHLRDMAELKNLLAPQVEPKVAKEQLSLPYFFANPVRIAKEIGSHW